MKKTMKKAWMWAGLACLIASGGCGPDNNSEADAATQDGATATDGATRDGGTCTGRLLCTSAGTTCDGNTLVVCAEDADGCLAQTRTTCSGATPVCSPSAAACVDACDGVAEADRCDTDGARSCDGETLEVCAPNATGCLVLERTECDAMTGGVCDDSGAAPACALPADPCASIPAAERCATEGTSCDGDSLVTCAPNAFGCLVQSEADCSSRAGGSCDDSGAAAACTFTGDPCEGVTQCGTEGTRCDGPVLATCAADAFGCLVETRSDCTEAPFGFCDADAAPAAMCVTAATDPCMGMDTCDPAAAPSCTDATTLGGCAMNAFGCYVATNTDCGASGLVCEGDTGAAACVATFCPQSQPTVLDCASGTVTGAITGQTTGRTAYTGCYSLTYASQIGQMWAFRHDPSARMRVQIATTQGTGSGDFDLFAFAPDASMSCTDTDLTCRGTSTSTGATETVQFVAEPGESTYVAYALFGSTGTTTTADYTLAVTCTPIVCGDGARDVSEGCDDGNTDDGDGCSATCTVEDGYRCTGEGAGSCAAIPRGVACTTAHDLGDAPTTSATFDLATGETALSGTGCGYPNGKAIWFKVTIPAHTIATITGTPNGFDALLRTHESCGTTTCLGYRDGSGSGGAESLQLANNTDAPLVRYASMNGYSSTSAGTFDITVSHEAIVCGDGVVSLGESCEDGNTTGGDGCSATCTVEDGYRCVGTGAGSCQLRGTNVSCAAARDLGDAPITVSGHTDDGATYTAPSATCGYASGKALWYTVTIPALTRATFTATPTDLDVVLRTNESCDATACLSTADVRGSGGVEALVIANPGDEPIRRSLAVLAYSSTNGLVELAVTHEAIVPPPPADITESASGLPLAIPDNNLTGVHADVTVGTCTVQWVRAIVGLNHTYLGDVRIRLRGPGGEEAVLSNRVGSSNDAIGTYTFASSGEAWPGSGSVIPDDRIYAANFSAFTGIDGAGTWSLVAADESSGIAGTLQSFTLELGCE